jgi:hypothetical protein
VLLKVYGFNRTARRATGTVEGFERRCATNGC